LHLCKEQTWDVGRITHDPPKGIVEMLVMDATETWAASNAGLPITLHHGGVYVLGWGLRKKEAAFFLSFLNCIFPRGRYNNEQGQENRPPAQDFEQGNPGIKGKKQ